MDLNDEREVEVTREKLRLLESRYEALCREPATDAHIRELTLRSFRRMINQMQEDIVRFQSRASLGQRRQ
jgi:hypothetical protein